ncbi:hypothetical protein [Vibrio salinus]|uniref:hypothetical protein n=1 Tax=Vibrio salinus TaxID=2899784 RepID=UPI001E33208F|nr:hypothetical protein [Vibrio salinus]MCE0495472.1 hypothetical protein [Vibrio salinus]
MSQIEEEPEMTVSETEEISVNADKFYVVSMRKFTILFFATFGLYQVYWAYKNWVNYKTETGEKVWPIARAIFQIFFTHSLFRKVDAELKGTQLPYSWHPAYTAHAYVSLLIVGRILDRLSLKNIGSPYTDLLGILVIPVIWYVLQIAQKAINISSGDSTGEQNDKLTVLNWFWIVVGLLFWPLAFAGVFLPE